MDGTNTHDRQIFTAALEMVREEVEKRAEDREFGSMQCNGTKEWCHREVSAELMALHKWITEQIEDES